MTGYAEPAGCGECRSAFSSIGSLQDLGYTVKLLAPPTPYSLPGHLESSIAGETADQLRRGDGRLVGPAIGQQHRQHVRRYREGPQRAGGPIAPAPARPLLPLAPPEQLKHV